VAEVADAVEPRPSAEAGEDSKVRSAVDAEASRASRVEAAVDSMVRAVAEVDEADSMDRAVVRARRAEDEAVRRHDRRPTSTSRTSRHSRRSRRSKCRTVSTPT
jgi:hypothetical protein